jgi:nucleotide-binding universal stress UspA family protein
LKARELALERLQGAKEIARLGAIQLKTRIRGWKILPVAKAGSPAWVIMDEAEKYQPDLLILGSHGKSFLHRFFLGSVSLKVANEVSCSVRVQKPELKPNSGCLKVAVGFDGSKDSKQALEEVLARHWPPDTQIRLITLLDPTVRSTSLFDAFYSAANPNNGDEIANLKRSADFYLKKMTEKGMTATYELREGENKFGFIQSVEEWGANCIFLAANGWQNPKGKTLGTFAAAILGRAPCTVEIVR